MVENNLNGYISRILSFGCVLVLLATLSIGCIIPASAYTTGDLVLEVGNSCKGSDLLPDSNHTFAGSKMHRLLLPDGTPLTARYFYDHQDYYFEISSDYAGSTGSYGQVRLASGNTIHMSSTGNRFDYELIYSIFGDSAYLDNPLYLVCSSGASSTVNGLTFTVSDALPPPPPPPPPPPDVWGNVRSLLNTVKSVVDMIFETAKTVMVFIWSEPLILTPVVIGFVLVAIAVCRKFVKR